jgi:hypothetical protein
MGMSLTRSQSVAILLTLAILLTVVTLLAVTSVRLFSWRRVSASNPQNDRAVIFRQLGVDLPKDVRNVHEFDMSIMAYHLWTTFEIPASEVETLFGSNDRVPAWVELKTSPPTTEQMFRVVKEVPSWWALSDQALAIASEREGSTKGNSPFKTQMCAIDLGDGFWRIYIGYHED